jgi:hypothetical protein
MKKSKICLASVGLVLCCPLIYIYSLVDFLITPFRGCCAKHVSRPDATQNMNHYYL